MYRPTVYIVDDDDAVRRSLAMWLGFRGLATQVFDSAESFLAHVDGNCRGCAILDVQLGSMNGLQLQNRLAEKQIRLPVLFLTAHGDVPTARNALKAGAFDFLEKPVDNDRLVEVVDAAIARDERYWESERESERVAERVARLTSREREVMDLVVAGRHNREIAVELGISARTVEVYKARLMHKLDVRRIPDLVRLVQPLQEPTENTRH